MAQFIFNDFASGADISWLPQIEAGAFGTDFIYRNRDGAEQSCLQTLKDYGLNAIRLRTWVNPSDNPSSGHCSAEETLDYALKAQKMGFDVMIDFHYGDTWCDPAKQVKPAAWTNLSFDDLVLALSDYTENTMKLYVNNGFVPKWVQLGNETNPGMLLPDGSTDNFPNLARLYTAGHDAVKKISPSTQTIIHLAEGNKTDFFVNYFDTLRNYGCRFDVIGMSYYPYWLNSPYEETIDDLSRTLEILPDRYDKDVMLVEIGGLVTEEERTHDLLIAVLERISRSPRCKGLFYWEPESALAFCKYPLGAWLDDGRPSHAMDAFLAIKCE